MKSRILIFCLPAFLLFLDVFAQKGNCDCKENLDSIIRHLPGNYPGWDWKDHISKAYLAHEIESFSKATKAKTPKNCHTVLNAYLAWFRDGHLGVSYSGDVFKPKKIKTKRENPWPQISEELAKKHLDSLAPTDSFSGIWESYESFYKALIVPNLDKTGFQAYLISTINQNWEPGEIKMKFLKDEKGKYQCTFYTSDHSEENPKHVLNRNLLEINKITVWNKIYPKTENPIPVEAFVSAIYKTTQEFKPWNKEVFYVQLQNANAGIKPLIDSLEKANRLKIENSKYLILDLRDNEGGDLTVFETFWPYIFTKPAVLFGTTYYCTSSNISAYEKQLSSIEGQVDPAFLDFLKEMKKHQGRNWTIPNDTLFETEKRKGPEKVILLINQKCKSSTEDFILATKSSSKVILAGQNSGGVADFEEVVDKDLPCPSLIFYHPIGFSNRLPASPIDGKGIKPDIELNSGSKAWQPWIWEVLKKLK
jgi:hypothetical protein